MIDTYHLEITKPVFDQQDINLLPFVSAERSTKVQRYRFDSDRLLSLYAALLTQMIISKQTGIPAAKLQFAHKKHGKPYLINDEKLHFNLSHTRNCIFLGISDHLPVGADVETLKKPPFEIMGRVFHPAEINYVTSVSEDVKAYRFFEIWTKKEAYLKKIGTGLTNDTNTFNTLTLPVTFDTYQIRNYLCTICYDAIIDTARHVVTEKELYAFYRTK